MSTKMRAQSYISYIWNMKINPHHTHPVFISLYALLFVLISGTRALKAETWPNQQLSNVKIYTPEKCFNGYTLFVYSRNSVPETLQGHPIYLIDMQGNVVHQWFAQRPTFHAQLKPDGNLIYHTLLTPIQSMEPYVNTNTPQLMPAPQDFGFGLYEIDYKSNETWYYPAFITHDFQILDNDLLLINDVERIFEPTITTNSAFERIRYSPTFKIINRHKEQLWLWRAEDHIDEIRSTPGFAFELISGWAHNNSCRLVGKNRHADKNPVFDEKNIIFSFCNLNAVGIIDYQTRKIVWLERPQQIVKQHTPHILENGNMLIFDNGNDDRPWSRVLEINPLNNETIWEYTGTPKESFYSKIFSSAFRLPNGNTLICEGLKDRIIEVTPEKEIVWEYSGIESGLNADIKIYRAYRYSPEYIKPLLERLDQWRKEENIP